MAVKFNLGPNESVILKDISVAHGGAMALYTDELILTNINIICVNKGVFGNTKNVYMYPLSQIKRYNGAPQAIMGKLPNGTASLEVYFMNGMEQFSFQMNAKAKTKKWISEICKLLGGSVAEEVTEIEYDTTTLAGAFAEMGSQFKEVGDQFKEALGIKITPANRSASRSDEAKITKKCISCSAPLIGYQGQVVHCKYCDTEQTL